MGLISKEKANGSIKLLFSSPISNTQIILGKFQSMLVCGLLLMSALFIYALFCYFTIHEFDMPHVLSGLLGIYLLTCAYAAIGLFMSTLTSYQVVAVVSTLAVLTIMNMIGDLGKNIAWLRDVAYWLSLKGRSNDMLQGLICSEDVIYYLLIITMFIMLSICKLNNERKRLSRSKGFMRYAIIVVVVFGLGQISTIPHLMSFYDATRTKKQTITPNSQEIMKELDGPMTITSYVNLLDPFYSRYTPNERNRDKNTFKQFTRFKPEIKFKYVYYWDKAHNPYLYAAHPGKTDEEIAKTLIEKLELDPDLFKRADEVEIPSQIKAEDNRFARIIEREDGSQSILRLFGLDSGWEPEEQQIAAAMKVLADGPCRLAFITGHGEPSIYRVGERGFSNFTIAALNKKALVNNGFEVTELNLKEQNLDTTKVDILVVTQMTEAFSVDEMKQLQQYLANGGNMLIAGDLGCQDFINPLLEDFGIQFMQGRIMQNDPNYLNNLALPKPTKEAEKRNRHYGWMNHWNYKVPMLNAVGIDYTNAASKGVETTVILETDSTGTWNELTHTAYTDAKAELNPESGEKEEAYAMAVFANRKVGDKEQRIVVTGDTDWMTNGERSTKRSRLNSNCEYFQNDALEWLTYGKYPVNVDRPSSKDGSFHIKTSDLIWIKGIFWFGLPLLLSICCISIQVKRKRK
jgi:ABC-2 type transport system permease protein